MIGYTYLLTKPEIISCHAKITIYFQSMSKLSDNYRHKPFNKKPPKAAYFRGFFAICAAFLGKPVGVCRFFCITTSL